MLAHANTLKFQQDYEKSKHFTSCIYITLQKAMRPIGQPPGSIVKSQTSSEACSLKLLKVGEWLSYLTLDWQFFVSQIQIWSRFLNQSIGWWVVGVSPRLVRPCKMQPCQNIVKSQTYLTQMNKIQSNVSFCSIQGRLRPNRTTTDRMSLLLQWALPSLSIGVLNLQSQVKSPHFCKEFKI